MRLLKWTILVIAALVIQGNALLTVEFFGAPGVKPDLLLILAIVYGLKKGDKGGSVFGFLTGLLQDSFSSGYLGTHALSKTIAGFLAGRMGRQFLWKNIITQVVLTFIISIVSCAINTGLLIVLAPVRPSETRELLDIMLASSAYNSLFAPFVFFLANKFTGDEKK